MKLSQYIVLPDPVLAVQGQFAANMIGSGPANFGLTTANAGQISAAASNYAGAYQNLLAAESEYRKAIDAKNAAKLQFGNVFSKYLIQSYGTSSVTNATLASINLDPKPSRGPFVNPTTPLDFFVEAFTNGYAKFKWRRNGNSNAVVYVIEAKTKEGAWTRIWAGTRSRMELSGFAPGVEVSFRVFASKGSVNSSPSNVAVIYPTGSSVGLRIAA